LIEFDRVSAETSFALGSLRVSVSDLRAKRWTMKVRVELGLDFEGQHTLGWQPSDTSGALDIPRGTLERWVAEHEAFKVATLRWKHVIEEVEDQLYRAERERLPPRVTGESNQEPPKARKSTALAAQLATVAAAPRRRPRG
jgi:hypothetical protein